jgi:hypothetical protein
MKLLPSLLLALVAAASIGVATAQGIRNEVGKPLQQAGDLLKAGKAREALAKVREAENAGAKNANEQSMIDRMKAAAAQRAGDYNTAIQAVESLYNRAGGSDKGQYAEQIASMYAQTRNNAKASEWLGKAQQAGNNGSGIRQLQAYLQQSGGDYAAIARDANAAVNGAIQAGRRPDENDLLRLADAQQRTGNTTGYIATLEKLLSYYPKKDYWNAYLGRLTRKPGFSDRFSLDVLRLKLASGTLTTTEDFMEMGQLALQVRLPAEALRIIEQGFKSGALGTGPEASRHQRLKELAMKRDGEMKAAIAQNATEAAAQKTGDDLVEAGYAYVTMGETDRGIKLIEQGIAKGGLKRPEDAKLRLGMAMLQSGKNRAKALQVLRSVSGKDGGAEVARLWTVVES